jgi:hypothetical protein
VTRFSKGWRRTHERREKACGLIRSRCRRGSGGRGKCIAALGAGIHAVNAIVTEGLNRDRIEPPQPSYLTWPQPPASTALAPSFVTLLQYASPGEPPTDSLALLVILGLTQALAGADRGCCGRGKGREV